MESCIKGIPKMSTLLLVLAISEYIKRYTYIYIWLNAPGFDSELLYLFLVLFCIRTKIILLDRIGTARSTMT